MEAESVSAPLPRARLHTQRREPAGRYAARPRRSSEDTAGSWEHACADCGDPLAWGRADCSLGLPLCQACARRRRTDPLPLDRMELAARLDGIRSAIMDEIRTAEALLTGTEFEIEARSWVGLIAGALDAEGLETPATCMSHTIARVRWPIIHSGSEW